VTRHDETVKVGVIGCGRIAQSVHLKILRSLPGVHVIGVAAPDPSCRKAASSLVPRASIVSDYRDLLAHKDVEAVVLSLPPAHHAEAAIAAFEAGKHVYLEKPMATDLRDGEAVIAAWERASRIGMMGFNYRFNSLYVEARDLIARGVLGKPVAIRSTFALAQRALAGWTTRRESGGGVLLELASHHVDLVRFLMQSEIVDLSCQIESRRTESDTAFVTLTLASGVTVQSFFSLCAVDEDKFEIYGDAGKITIDRSHAMAVEYRSASNASYRADQLRHQVTSLKRLGYGFVRNRAPGHEPSWQLALAHFVGAVRGQQRATPDLHDGLESLRILLAAEQAASCAQREPV